MAKNRIGALRREYGMNQKELGTYLGVGQTTVSAWETGKNEPDTDSMHKMAKLFHVSIGYLSGYEEGGFTRGLSKAEFNEYQNELAYQRELQAIHRFEQQQELYEQGISEAELEEYLKAELMQEWEETDKSMYLEVFQINKMCDYLSEEQRKRLLAVATQMFPYAAQGKYTEEIPHK